MFRGRRAPPAGRTITGKTFDRKIKNFLEMKIQSGENICRSRLMIGNGDGVAREDGGRRGYDPETYSRLVWALEDAER